MKIPNDLLAQLQALERSPARRVIAKFAAKYLGVSVRCLEEWRRSWNQAAALNDPTLRRGPRFFKIGKNVRYEIGDLDAFLAESKAKPDAEE